MHCSGHYLDGATASIADMVSIPNIDEFLDDHEEQHAVGTGIGLGFAAASTGQLQQLSIVLTLIQQVFERKNRPAPSQSQDLANDIRREPHYFVAAVVVGALLGLAVREA